MPVNNSSIRVIARPILNYGEKCTILRSISVLSNREDETWKLCHGAECAITRSYCIAMGHSRKTINGRTNSSRTAETFYMLPNFLHAAWRFFSIKLKKISKLPVAYLVERERESESESESERGRERWNNFVAESVEITA